MGDAALSTGVLNYWGSQLGLRFTVLTKKGLGDIFKNHPAVTKVVELDLNGLSLMATMRLFTRLSREYKGKGLVDLHGNLRTRWLSSLWQGPVRRYPKFGLERRIFLRAKNLPSGSGFWRGLSNTTVPQRYALALESTPVPASLLKPVMFLERSELDEAAGLLSQALGLEPAGDFSEPVQPDKPGRSGQTDRAKSLPRTVPWRPVVALHPYASHQPKAWPGKHWQALAALLDAAGIPWICLGRAPEPFFGTPNDLSNRTTLRQSAALLRFCSLLVTADSGPMHLARAVNTRLLALSGPTVREWGFYPEPDEGRVLELNLPCRPCSLHGKKKCPLPEAENCLFRITPATVFQNIEELL